MLFAPEPFDEDFVLMMRSDPEPCDLIPLNDTYGAIADGYSDRENRSARVNPLKVEARVVRILGEQSVDLFRALPNFCGKCFIALPESLRSG
jgi:hypothetical protein